jgi:hypothetical protein
MLEIEISSGEFWDEDLQEFVYAEPCKLTLEHSLISLSKWESKWNKPFLSADEKTLEETRDYVRCMTINKNVSPTVYAGLTSADYKKIDAYISAPMTATTFSQHGPQKRGRAEIMTAEVIYYYMIALGIPFECEKWHLTRLLTLIRVCSIKNAPSKKMGKGAAAKQQRALNAQRRACSGSRG